MEPENNNLIKYCPGCKTINSFRRKEPDKLKSDMYICNGCNEDFSESYILSYDSRRRLESFRKGFRF